jgi:VanZ family protein
LRRFWEHQSVRWAAVVAWMGLIFFLSAQSTLPDLTGGRPDLQDVAGHFLVYAGLALLLLWAMTGAGVRHAALWALAIAVLYGASDEFHQGFVPGRNPDVFDLATDAAGAAAAIVLATWVRARRRARSEAGPVDSAIQPQG